VIIKKNLTKNLMKNLGQSYAKLNYDKLTTTLQDLTKTHWKNTLCDCHKINFVNDIL